MEKDEILQNEEALKRRKSPSKKKHSVVIIEDLCKGCDICINVCPTGVLLLVDDEKNINGVIAKVDAPEYCTGCLLCELRCPDFAIVVDSEKRANYYKKYMEEAEIAKTRDLAR
ncbi:MAG: 4Fe-4S dicluster domain-containing protein [Acidobacteriota bacterium]